MSFFEKMIDRFELVGRARTLSVLRQLSDRTLEDAGFSPELVRIGIKAYPWRTEEAPITLVDSAPIAAAAKPAFSANVAAGVGQVIVPAATKVANEQIETAA